VRDHYLRFLSTEYPDLAALHTRLYPGKYAPPEVRARLDARVGELKQQYGLIDQSRPPRHPRQLELAFSAPSREAPSLPAAAGLQ
jgi:hypothetical protein